MVKKKNPWVAAILNFIIFGLGYLYLRKRMGLGIGLLIGDILLNFMLFTLEVPLNYVEKIYALGIPLIIIGLALAYDAYKEAR